MFEPSEPQTFPIVWTAAGSDSGGGAGIQADLRTFSYLKVYGCSVITALTAQNPREVKRVEAVSPEMVASQLQALWEVLPPAGMKTGMLFSLPVIEILGEFVREKKITTVTDPVMVSTSGRSLLEKEALNSLRKNLFPHVTLLTPNIPEAELLSGQKITSFEEMLRSAVKCVSLFNCSILLKGGHLQGGKECTDLFLSKEDSKALFLTAPQLSFPPYASHGTGCTLSSAITAFLAKGHPLPESIRKAKAFVLGSLTESIQLQKEIFAMFPPVRPLEEYEKMIQCREETL